MATELMEKPENALSGLTDEEKHQFVTMQIANQLIGISVLQVEDVLRPRSLTPIPLAPPEIAGVLNLRGRIVTALDLRVRLGLDAYKDYSACMSIVAGHKGQLYSFLIDSIGDVLTLPLKAFEKAPPNLETRWRDVASGVYRLDGKLMVVIDIERLLDLNIHDEDDTT